MSRTDDVARPSVDARTRSMSAPSVLDPAVFWDVDWNDALARNGARAAADAARLGLRPARDRGRRRRVDPAARAKRRSRSFPGGDATPLQVALDREAFTDLVLRAPDRARARDRRSGRRRSRVERGVLCVGSRAALRARRARRVPARATSRCARSTARRSISTSGSGSAITRPRPRTSSPRPGSCSCRACSPTRRWTRSTPTSPAPSTRRVPTTARRGGRRRVRASATRAASSTSPGSRERCAALLADPRFLAIGELLGDGHRPGDPFGEHFADVTAEGLVKRVGSVEGLACLPWHKDCERGGHSMFCSGLTVGRLPDAGRRGARRARRGRGLAPCEHRARPGRPRARPSAGHAPRRSRRPDRAHVVRAAPVDASRRAASGASPTPASRCRRGPATATPQTRSRVCDASAPPSATRARARGSRRDVEPGGSSR